MSRRRCATELCQTARKPSPGCACSFPLPLSPVASAAQPRATCHSSHALFSLSCDSHAPARATRLPRLHGSPLNRRHLWPARLADVRAWRPLMCAVVLRAWRSVLCRWHSLLFRDRRRQSSGCWFIGAMARLSLPDPGEYQRARWRHGASGRSVVWCVT